MENVEFERIEDYLNGSMSEQERSRFESDLSKNKELADAFALYSSIQNTMRSTHEESNGEDALRQTLKELGAVYFASSETALQPVEVSEGPTSSIGNAETQGQEDEDGESGSTKTRRLWPRVAVAAGFIGIVATSIIWFSRQQRNADLKTVENKANNSVIDSRKKQSNDVAGTRPDTAAIRSAAPKTAQADNNARIDTLRVLSKTRRDALFARYFKPDAPPEQHDEFLNDAYSAYEKNDYSKAIAEFENVASTPLTRGETTDESQTIFQAQYYQALSYLASGSVARAIAGLKRIAANNHYSETKVQWYLSLAYTKQNQLSEARQTLLRLSKDKEAKQYKQEAENLLRELGYK